MTADQTSWTATYEVDEACACEDTDVAGFTISFQDLAGNPGVLVTESTDGSIVAIDLTLPSIETLFIASDNQYEQDRANMGDTLKVKVTTGELIVVPTVAIANKEMVVLRADADVPRCTMRDLAILEKMEEEDETLDTNEELVASALSASCKTCLGSDEGWDAKSKFSGDALHMSTVDPLHPTQRGPGLANTRANTRPYQKRC